MTLREIEETIGRICDTYASSKVLRLGSAYLDTPERFRHVLSEETSHSTHALQLYGHYARNYFHQKESKYAIWSTEEENTLFDNYQRTTMRKLMKLLPNRSVFTIKKKASLMGLTKQRR